MNIFWIESIYLEIEFCGAMYIYLCTQLFG